MGIQPEQSNREPSASAKRCQAPRSFRFDNPLDSTANERLITIPHPNRRTPCGLENVSERGGFDFISDALPFGGLWYGEPTAVSDAAGYAKFYSRSHDVVIRVYDELGSVIQTHEHKGDFKEP